MVTFLRGLAVRYFRGIKSVELDGFTDINVFIGRNCVGKSSILEAIYLASSFAKDNDYLTGTRKIDVLLGRRTDRSPGPKDILWYDLDTSRHISFDLIFHNNKKLSLKLIHKDIHNYIWMDLGSFIDFSQLYIRERFLYYNFLRNLVLDPETGVSIHPSEDYQSVFYKQFRDIVNVFSNTILIDEKTLREPYTIEQKLWPRILAKRLDKEIVRIIARAYEESVEDFTYMPFLNNNYLVLKLPNKVVRVDDLGDGARIAIYLLAILIQLDNSIVLIEDPEVHQHPGGIYAIMDFLTDIIKDKRLQVFMSTHSIELIRILKSLTDEKEIKLRIFFLEKENGIINARVIESIDIEVANKLGIDIRLLELF